MAIPGNKKDLIAAIQENYLKLKAELDSIPPERAMPKALEGHAQNTLMSVHNLVAYLLGWGELVLKWNELKDKGLAVDFPETGFKWNELGQLAQKFYADYAEEDFDTLLQKLDLTVHKLLQLTESKTDQELYGIAWYEKYPLGRMIQLNTASPYQNARNRIRKWKKTLLFFGLAFLSQMCVAQIDTVAFSLQATHLFPSFPYKSSYASHFDRRNGFDYVYSANMEFGLGIYEISNPNEINPVLDLPIATFDNLDVSTLAQKGNSLFVGIGDFHVKDNPASGLAILDISNPESPQVKDIWDSTQYKHGISHLLLDGNYAYLATMSDGIIILDVSDEQHIAFKSHLALDLNFPAPSNNAHNARGMAFRNDTLYVCFDRGGLRMVDVKDKSHPMEIYKYINTTLNSQAAAAYNDIAVKGHYAFVSVDYCGMEVLDIGSTPFNSIQWYNPWGCNGSNWSGAALHANELRLANNDSLLLVAAGQSELFAFDVSDPLQFAKAGEYAYLYDTLATYGLDVYRDKVVLSFLRTPFHIPPFTPFFADPGGLKILDYAVKKASSHLIESGGGAEKMEIYPNPSAGEAVCIRSDAAIESLEIRNALGQLVYRAEGIHNERVTLDVGGWNAGVYYLRIEAGKSFRSFRLILMSPS